MEFFGLFLMFFGRFEHFCSWRVTLWHGNTVLTPKSLTYTYLTRTKWLMADMTAVGISVRAESEVFWVEFDYSWPIQAACVVGEQFCDLEPLFGALKPYLWSFSDNEVVGGRFNIHWGPSHCRNWSFLVMFNIFWQIWAAFAVEEQLCDLETPSCALTTLLMII